jgi:hypothetical protein
MQDCQVPKNKNAKFGHWQFHKRPNSEMGKKFLFSSRLKKGQEKAKWPDHFISSKLFQKRPNCNPAHMAHGPIHQ